ncbi:MAG: hypothetical protein WC733_01100 [Methylophilus sp.]|jgi:peptidoglycan hydrolase CwlO-like protein
MTQLKLTTSAFIILFVSIYSSNLLARDIANEQRNATEAREQYNKAQANYSDVTQSIAALEQQIAEQQAQLEVLKNKQATAESKLETSKANLDEKVQLLEQAWANRDK